MTEREYYAAEQQRQMKIMKHLKDSTGIKCEECESQIFNEGYLLRKISKLLTGEASDIVQPIPVFSCSSCGHINSEFKPKEFSIDEASGKVSD
jgi:hypothetical protein